MPHNWASAECVRYLRHMLALEDAGALRLLEGITASEINGSGAYVVRDSPTRFGRIRLTFEPAGKQGWRLQFELDRGPAPVSVTVPETIADLHINSVSGASYKKETGRIEIDPTALRWEAFWK